MNGQAAASMCQVSSAGIAYSPTPIASAAAVAASVSGARASSRFQTACRTAAASARATALPAN